MITDVIVASEGREEHFGTWPMLRRVFDDPDRLLLLQAGSGTGATGPAQATWPSGVGSRDVYRWVLTALDGLAIERVLCVPWCETDLRVALAVHHILDVPLGLYIAHDRNVHATHISDRTMEEALDAADVRLAITSDMRDVYECKWQLPFALLPPLPMRAPPRDTAQDRSRPDRGAAADGVPDAPAGSVVVLGDRADGSWMAPLATGLMDVADASVTWWVDAPERGWWRVRPNHDGTAADLVHPATDAQLVSLLQRCDAVVIAIGEDNTDAGLAVPVALMDPIIHTTAPVIVAGPKDSAAARFVAHLEIGLSGPLDGGAIRELLGVTRQAVTPTAGRARVGCVRAALTLDDPAGWLRASIDGGQAPCHRFDALELPATRAVRQYLHNGERLGPWLHNFDPVVSAFSRLRRAGYRPDFVVDVGASTGVWSTAVHHVYPDSRYVLVEPLASRYDPPTRRALDGLGEGASLVEGAIGDSDGGVVFHVDPQLYGSSLRAASVAGVAGVADIEVRLTTLETVASEAGITGRGVLKLDIQGGELTALAGAGRFLEAVDVIVVETTLDPGGDELPNFDAIHAMMGERGFVMLDDVGEWRHPTTGALIQKDFLYVRRTHQLVSWRRSL